MDHLPMVLLGTRITWHEDPDCSPAELVNGSTLKIPGEFFDFASAQSSKPSSTFLHDLQNFMRNALPIPVKYHSVPNSYVPSSLSSTGYVYVSVDGYDHPLLVYNDLTIDRFVSSLHVIHISLRTLMAIRTILTKNLKPAFVGSNILISFNSPVSYQPLSVSHPTTVTTKHSRTIRPLKHLTNDYVSAVALQILCVFFVRFVLKLIDLVLLTRKTVKFTVLLISCEK